MTAKKRRVTFRRRGVMVCEIARLVYFLPWHWSRFCFKLPLLSAKFVVATQHGMRDVLTNVRLRGKPSGK